MDLRARFAVAEFARIPISPYIMPGDYNHDALVDSFDYQVWRLEYGRTSGYVAADGNGDGVVDSADYDFWRNNRTSGSGAGEAAVIPEPGSWTLFVSALLMGFSVTCFRPRGVSHILF